MARLILVLVVTLREVAGLTRPTTRTSPMKRARRWGLRASKILGLQITFSGKLPDAPVICVANHRSYTDILALMTIQPSFFLAKQEVASWPIIGSAARNCKTIFVQRENRESRRRAKAEIAQRVQSGETITVFCEGTTSRGPGLLPFRPGVFYLAAERDLTIVPVAIQYASPEDAWIDDDSLVRHFFDRFRRKETPIKIAVGPTLRGRDGGALKQAAASWIAETLKRHPILERRPVCPSEISTATSFSAALPAS